MDVKSLAALLATALVTSGCDLDTLRGEKSATKEKAK